MVGHVDVVGFIPVIRPICRPGIEHRNPIAVVLEARIPVVDHKRESVDSKRVSASEVDAIAGGGDTVGVIAAALSPTAVVGLPVSRSTTLPGVLLDTLLLRAALSLLRLPLRRPWLLRWWLLSALLRRRLLALRRRLLPALILVGPILRLPLRRPLLLRWRLLSALLWRRLLALRRLLMPVLILRRPILLWPILRWLLCLPLRLRRRLLGVLLRSRLLALRRRLLCRTLLLRRLLPLRGLRLGMLRVILLVARPLILRGGWTSHSKGHGQCGRNHDEFRIHKSFLLPAFVNYRLLWSKLPAVKLPAFAMASTDAAGRNPWPSHRLIAIPLRFFSDCRVRLRNLSDSFCSILRYV